MEEMALKEEIRKAIFILESSLTVYKSQDILIGDIAIPRRDAEALKQKLECFQKDGQAQKIFKAIPLKLVVVSEFWGKLQRLIRNAYISSE